MDMTFPRSDWSSEDAIAFSPAPARQAAGLPATPPVSLATPSEFIPLANHRFGAAACEDVPVAVGALIAGSYAAVLVSFCAVFLAAGDVLFMIAICAVYLVVYLGVPIVLLRMERSGRLIQQRPWADFLRSGMSTWTGQTSAVAALAQILTIPLSLVLAVAGIGLMMNLAA